MGRKDAVISQYLTDAKRFCDLFNGTIFQGNQVLLPQKMTEMPQKKTLVFSGKNKGKSASVKDKFTLERIRDSVMKRDFQGIYGIFACEHQNETDYSMPVREMVYDGVEYASQIKKVARKNRREKKYQDTGAFLSGFGKGDRLIPVFNIVLYYGNSPWKGSRSLQEMMEIPKELEKFRKYLPDYRIFLVDAKNVQTDYFKTEWKQIFSLLSYADSKEKMEEYLKQHSREYENLDEESNQVLFCMLNEYSFYKKMKEEKGEMTMCRAFDEIREESRQEGIREEDKKLEKLGNILVRENLMEDLKKAMIDSRYKQSLYQKYHIM